MEDLGHALETLSRAGLRRTPQRVAVIEALIGNTSHPTVEAVWSLVREHMPSISLSTVYATVRELESLGLIQRVGEDPLRYDPDVGVHIHLTCEICGRIVDVPDEGAEDVARDVAQRHGHTVERVTVTLGGTCDRCRRQRRRRVPKA